MKQMLKQKLREKLANSEGFTLLEILVVLTIMGFLIAMVGPRLAGISDSAVDTVCDSNQNRMIGYLASYVEQTGDCPNRVTNIVMEDVTLGTYQIPRVSDDDPENGPETLSSELYARNHFHIHHLSAAEAQVLREHGVVTVLNLNSYDGQDDAGINWIGGVDPDVANALVPDADRGASMAEANVAAALGVAMTGMGVDAAGAWVASNVTERGWGEPDWFGRISFGLGPECALITSGIIANAAHCPGGIRNADNVTYNDYNVVLGRMQETVDTYDPTVTAMDEDAALPGIQLTACSYDVEPAALYNMTANADHLRCRTYDLESVSGVCDYETQCPEGHSYPEDDGEFWGINLDAAAPAILN